MLIKNESPKPKVPKSKRKHRVVIDILISVLMLLSLALVFNKPIMEAYINHVINSKAAINTSALAMSKNANKKGNYDPNSAVPVSPSNLVKAAIANQSRPVTGLVAMPAIGINLPVFLDDGDYTMLYGAGQLQANQEMGKGNYVIASHDMWTNADYYSKTLLFSPLKQAHTGQDIYLTNKKKVYHYVVTTVERILPTEWDHAVGKVPGKAVVTLLTCDTNDHYRIMVRGKLKSVNAFNNTTSKPFNSKFNQYWH